MDYRQVFKDEDRETWDATVSHPMQSWMWGEFRKKRQQISRLGVFDGSTMIRGFLIVWTRIPLTNMLFGYIPMGPIPTESDLTELYKLATKMNSVGIRMEPNAMLGASVPRTLTRGRSLFKKKTIILDLTQSEEDLLKNMHPKSRYNIKVALKHGVEIKKDDSDRAFDSYLNLMFKGTASRQKIYSHGATYHRQLWNTLKGNISHLFVANYENKTLVADIIFRFKEKIYYAYGATALEHKEVMAPTFLLWEIIRWGKREGATIFDLWGAEEGKGFTRFKEQFGGTIVETVGTYDLSTNTILYKIFRFLEDTRWRILRLIR